MPKSQKRPTPRSDKSRIICGESLTRQVAGIVPKSLCGISSWEWKKKGGLTTGGKQTRRSMTNVVGLIVDILHSVLPGRTSNTRSTWTSDVSSSNGSLLRKRSQRKLFSDGQRFSISSNWRAAPISNVPARHCGAAVPCTEGECTRVTPKAGVDSRRSRK